jgi:hypothetical protein
MEACMGVSPEFLAASRRMRQIGQELLEIKKKQLVSALKGPNVREIVVEQTIGTLKIKAIRIKLESGRELLLRASGIEDILMREGEPQDPRVLELEREWATINKKWHLYP